MHFLDGFLMLGPPTSPVCKQALDTTLEQRWVPVATQKAPSQDWYSCVLS